MVCPPRGDTAGSPSGMCSINVDTLSAYFDSELSAGTQIGVALHGARCPRCARILAEFQTVRALLRSLSDQQVAVHQAWRRH